VTCNKTKSPVT